MAVDFASKQRDRGGEGWGLRNAKLRMSRKLIFASGLLLCFSCNLDPKLSDTIPKGQISTDENVIKQNLVKHIQELVRQSPLELVAQSLIKYSVPDALQKDLFGAYAEFLELLDDEKSRNDLKKLRAEDAHSDTTFNKVKEISSTFQRSLDRIFFEHEDLGRLTRKYGVF